MVLEPGHIYCAAAAALVIPMIITERATRGGTDRGASILTALGLGVFLSLTILFIGSTFVY